MSEAVFRKEGLTSLDYVADQIRSAGEVIQAHGQTAVVMTDLAAGAAGAVYVRGVFDVAKTAALEISAGDAVYWNYTTNKATKTSTDWFLGIATAAAAAADETVQVYIRSVTEAAAEQISVQDLSNVEDGTPTAGNLLIGDGDSFESGKAGPTSLATVASGAAGAPILIRKVCVASGAEDVTVLASAPVKLLITDAWMVARGTDVANVTLKNGANAFTGAVAKGATDNAIVRFGSIIAAYDELVATTGSIVATFSAAGAVDVFVLAVPIA